MEKDRSWEIVQQKAFTAWLNETIQHRGMRVNSLHTDLTDGIVLINFFEILSDKKIKQKYDTAPQNKISKIQNLHIALTFLEKEMEVRNPGCSAEDIIDTETKGIKLVLGLLWTLFRKYRIAVISVQDKSSEEGLLLWVKQVTEDYNGVHIDKWKSSFCDGMAFLAMVHRYNPEKTEVKYENFSKENPEVNLTTAFELAEKELGIPKLLDVHEVMEGRVDERSLHLYTSLFFHAFKAAAVASELERKRAETEGVLEAEKNKKIELLTRNQQLEEEILRLKKQLEDRDTQNLSLNQTIQEKESHNLSLNRQLDEVNLHLDKKTQAHSDSETVNLKLRKEIEGHTERILGLEKSLENLVSEKESANENNALLNTVRSELEQKLKEQQKQTEETILGWQDKEKAALDKHREALDKIAQLERELESAHVDIAELRKLIGESKSNLEMKQNQEGVQRKGLQVLKKNLEQHIDDMHRWQKYLEYDKKSTFDFDVDVKPQITEEMDKHDFIEQLEYISGKLDAENDFMQKILAQKKNEAQLNKNKKPAAS